MKQAKSREHRLEFDGLAGIVRKGVPFHMDAAAWDYGRKHALPLWMEYIVYPAIYSHGYKFSQTNVTLSSFELVLEGSMIVQLDDDRLIVKPNEFCLIPAGKTKTLEVREYCRKVVFGICGQLHLSLLAMTGLCARPVIRLGRTDRILSLLRELHGLLKEKSESSIPRIEGLSMELIAEIAGEAGRTPEPLLADAFRFFEYNLSAPLDLSSVAEALHVTPNYLNRLFRKELGIPPKRYLTGLRMQQAFSLLNSTRLSIQEISARCGYRNQFAFSREFRKKYGKSPLEVRKSGNGKKKI